MTHANSTQPAYNCFYIVLYLATIINMYIYSNTLYINVTKDFSDSECSDVNSIAARCFCGDTKRKFYCH